MAEVPTSPEIEEMLPKAVKEVGGLYLGDRLASLLRTQPPEQRDEFWKKAAERFSPFGENIKSLREALKAAEATKVAYPPQIEAVMKVHFSDVEDEVARDFLTDILFARTIVRPGYMDYRLVERGGVVKEAEMMIRELGVEGLRSEEAKKITFDKVVEGVLTGVLKLTRQTKIEEK